jgi:hypothetical protein
VSGKRESEDWRQRGFPEILPEEAPLPSEVVLSGGLLQERRRQALASLRELHVDRPDGIAPEEWRVIVAELAPPTGHLPRAPGTAAKAHGRLQAARECFPLLSATAAVAKFLEVLARPAVRAYIADVRALEMLDVLEQRGLVREALHGVITRGTEGVYRVDPAAAPVEWAKVAASTVMAAKVLVDMDGLKRDASPVEDGDADKVDDPTETLLAKSRRVLADLRARVPETA